MSASMVFSNNSLEGYFKNWFPRCSQDLTSENSEEKVFARRCKSRKTRWTKTKILSKDFETFFHYGIFELIRTWKKVLCCSFILIKSFLRKKHPQHWIQSLKVLLIFSLIWSYHSSGETYWIQTSSLGLNLNQRNSLSKNAQASR